MTVDDVAELIVSARNSGVNTCKSIIDESWLPKNPDEIESDVISLVSDLNEKEKEQLINAIRYFTDLSIFKFIEILELGEGGLSFELKAISHLEELSLINSEEDLELRVNFFNWIDSMGS